MGLGDFDRAQGYFKTNLKNNPDDPNMYEVWPNATKNMGENKEAIRNPKISFNEFSSQ